MLQPMPQACKKPAAFLLAVLDILMLLISQFDRRFYALSALRKWEILI
jgi:hypothetical protein